MKIKFLLLAILAAVIFTGCGIINSYGHLNHEEALKIMQTQNDVIILDVRTQEEYDKRHIPNAVLLPIEEIKKGNFAPLKDKKQKILVYCWTGRRAEDATKILAESGYSNVFEFGGLVDWTGETQGNEE